MPPKDETIDPPQDEPKMDALYFDDVEPPKVEPKPKPKMGRPKKEKVQLVPLTVDDLKVNRALMPFVSMDLFLRYGLSDELTARARKMCKELGFECPRKGNPKK